MAVARGWTYTQCLVETEATYTRFPGVMGKDRVIRMHSSSSRLQTRHTRAHTELSISRISNTWPRVQQAFLESLGLVNKFEKSVLEQQPTDSSRFFCHPLASLYSLVWKYNNVYRSEQEEKVLKKRSLLPWKMKNLEKCFKILGKLFSSFLSFFFFFLLVETKFIEKTWLFSDIVIIVDMIVIFR